MRACLLQPAAQIGESRTVGNNIIDDQHPASGLDLPHKHWLAEDPSLNIGEGVRYDIDLADAGFEIRVEMFRQRGRINDRKSVRLVSIELHDRNDGIKGEQDLLGVDYFLYCVIGG